MSLLRSEFNSEQNKLVIQRASEELPAELRSLLKENAAATRKWDKLTKAQQRMLR